MIRTTHLLLAICACVPAAHGIDAIEFEAREITVADIPVNGARLRLDLLAPDKTHLTLGAREIALPDPAGKLADINLTCARPVIAEPEFACGEGRLTARGGPTGALDMQVDAGLRIDNGALRFSGKGQKLAGTTASFDALLDEQGWKLRAGTGPARISGLRKFAAPWFTLPADITGDGDVRLQGEAADAGRGLQADVTVTLADVDLTNEASTIVTDKMAARARLRAETRGEQTHLDLELDGTGGQVLASTILLDFGRNPLQLRSRAVQGKDALDIESLRIEQRDALYATVRGRLALAGEIPAFTGELQLEKVEFPAAFSSYVQLLLATSLLGDATTSGSLSGEVRIVDNGVAALHVVPRDMGLQAHNGRLNLVSMDGDIHWSPAGGDDARISRLGWKSGGAYGLSGGAAQIEFIAYGSNFALTRPTKLPIFDGAIAIDNFAMGNLGADNMEVAFTGAIEPISMPLLAKAFGWPEFSGTIAASIPGVRLKDNVLNFDGNVESQVFGGQIVGSNIRLQDPLGNFPQFFADVRARDLDLGLVTQTFEVGSITGKLEADVLGLELFAWTPQAFDARLATPQGDKSRRRISAKAVSSLSNVGGGGGGVVQALQSGVLRFFDEYSYEKLGIRCRLRGDICEMSGVEPAPNGYYIVKGSGLPRIDIVGNQGRVSWNQLLSSIATADFGSTTVE